MTGVTQRLELLTMPTKSLLSDDYRFRPSLCPCGRKWEDCPWWGRGASMAKKEAREQRQLHGCDGNHFDDGENDGYRSIS